MGKSFRGRLSTSVQASQDDSAPVLNESTDSYAKVVESRGKGQFVVIVPSTTLSGDQSSSMEVLVYMPPKFRNTLWVRRGSFVIIRKDGDWESASISNGGSLLKGELIHVLSAEQIKELKKEGKWPQEFTDKVLPVIETESESESELQSESEDFDSNFNLDSELDTE